VYWGPAGLKKYPSKIVKFSWSLPLKLSLLIVVTSTCLLTPAPSLAAEGIGRQALTTSILRVCADPDNLPYSNKKRQGFENRIIELIAAKLGREVRYTWFPQSIGFVRNTLRLRECDLISGITTTSERVQNTNPYYHSVYTMVYRKDAGLDATTMSDPQLRDLKLGVVAGTPPASIIAQLGLLGNIKPYQLFADTRRYKPARQAILDVGNGETDVAFIWGPIAAFYAREAASELVLVPLVNEDRRARLSFRVSMAVRYNETEWKHTINSVLKELQPEINDILQEFDVPLLNDRRALILE
jgi:quinoprotein dehydrogenase-associated probable ABC transporter substrate-binding protein